MVTKFPHLLDMNKILEIKKQKDAEYARDMKKWEEENPELAKSHKITRIFQNVQSNKRRFSEKQLNKQLSAARVVPTVSTVPTVSVTPAPTPIEVAPYKVPAAAAVALPAPGMQQIVMAVKFMVKDEHHKAYLLYLLDTNESTQSIGIPIRIQGFLKAALYLCDASLYEYLKAISEKE